MAGQMPETALWAILDATLASWLASDTDLRPVAGDRFDLDALSAYPLPVALIQSNDCAISVEAHQGGGWTADVAYRYTVTGIRAAASYALAKQAAQADFDAILGCLLTRMSDGGIDAGPDTTVRVEFTDGGVEVRGPVTYRQQGIAVTGYLAFGGVAFVVHAAEE